MSDLLVGDHFVDPDDPTLDLEVTWNGTRPLMPDRTFDGRRQLGRYAFEGQKASEPKRGVPAHQGPRWRDDLEVA